MASRGSVDGSDRLLLDGPILGDVVGNVAEVLCGVAAPSRHRTRPADRQPGSAQERSPWRVLRARSSAPPGVSGATRQERRCGVRLGCAGRRALCGQFGVASNIHRCPGTVAARYRSEFSGRVVLTVDPRAHRNPAKTVAVAFAAMRTNEGPPGCAITLALGLAELLTASASRSGP